ncbi:MAG: restriction endonuclease subunit S [Pirellulaceae bacterium]|nr:restriction endonuclease subunit S [Pirellulaceae bacterium]
MYGKLRPYLNKVCVPEFDGVCSTDILVFPPSTAIENRFLLLLLSQPRLVTFAHERSSGINLPRIGADELGEFAFDLPPLPEQRRIVAAIEALQERSRRAREALESIPPMLEQFRQSVLASAFRGDLTADWRAAHPDVEPASELLKRIRAERRRQWEEAELAKMQAKGKTPKDDKWKEKYQEPEPVDTSELPELPREWCWAALGELLSAVSPLCYGVVQPGDETHHGVRLIRVCDIQDGRVNATALRRISEAIDEQYARSRVRGSEILLSVVGTIGRVAVVTSGLAGANIARAIARLTPLEHIPKRWLMHCLNTPRLQDWLVRGSREVARKTLNLGVLERAVIPVAPTMEMAETVRLVDGLLADDAIKMLVGESSSCLQELDQSILAKAFRGELVPQNPNDEPASVLLERIRAEREAAAGKGKPAGRRKRAPRQSQPATEDTTDEPASPNGRRLTQRRSATPREASAPAPTRDPLAETPTDDIMAAFRKACWGAGDQTEDQLLRAVAGQLGYQRVRQDLRASLQKHLRTAIRRRILERDGDTLRCPTLIFRNYDDDFLLQALRRVMAKNREYTRDDVLHNLALHLGYSHVTDAMRERMRSVFRLAIRAGVVGYRGTVVWVES